MIAKPIPKLAIIVYVMKNGREMLMYSSSCGIPSKKFNTKFYTPIYIVQKASYV